MVGLGGGKRVVFYLFKRKKERKERWTRYKFFKIIQTMSPVLNQVLAASVRIFPIIPNGDSCLFPRQEESMGLFFFFFFKDLSQSLVFTLSKRWGEEGRSLKVLFT